MAKFTKIGYGNITKTKNGKSAIALVLDPEAQKKLMNHDFESSIWIFKNEGDKGIYYTVMTPMPDEYEFVAGKSKKQKTENYNKTQDVREALLWKTNKS